MTCAEARDALLEADLAEIRGEADTPLGDHLTTCERCQAAAAAILGQQGALARALDHSRPRTPVETALERVRGRLRARASRRRALRWAAPLAAAAGIAGVAVLRNGGGPSAAPDSPAVPDAPVAFDLGLAPDRNVAVFESAARPNVVVVWFY